MAGRYQLTKSHTLLSTPHTNDKSYTLLSTPHTKVQDIHDVPSDSGWDNLNTLGLSTVGQINPVQSDLLEASTHRYN